MMKQLGFTLDTKNDCIRVIDREMKLETEIFQPIHTFDVDDFESFCGFSMEELNNLHRSLGHPSESNVALLEKADPSNCSEIRQIVDEIVSKCKPCQTPRRSLMSHQRTSPRFKLSARIDDAIINIVVEYHISFNAMLK